MELLTDKVIYHVETQEDYNNLMERLKKWGCEWSYWETCTSVNYFLDYGENTAIRVGNKKMSHYPLNYYLDYLNDVYEDHQIIKYKKDQNMKVKLKAEQKFIADWYEENKDDLEYAIYHEHMALNKLDREDVAADEFLSWMNEGKNEPIQTLVKMKLFGYELEQEPLYRVLIPNPNVDESGNKFILEKREKGVILAKRRNKNIYLFEDNQKLTEAEIKKDFEWAWEFAKEV